MLGERPAWMSHGACNNVSPGLFYPDPEDTKRKQAALINAAKAICRGCCPVRTACLKYALENNETEGVWGGHSARERREMRSRLKRRSEAAAAQRSAYSTPVALRLEVRPEEQEICA